MPSIQSIYTNQRRKEKEIYKMQSRNIKHNNNSMDSIPTVYAKYCQTHYVYIISSSKYKAVNVISPNLKVRLRFRKFEWPAWGTLKTSCSARIQAAAFFAEKWKADVETMPLRLFSIPGVSGNSGTFSGHIK